MDAFLSSGACFRFLALTLAVLGTATAQPQNGYRGEPQVIPGRVELELSDTGGLGVDLSHTKTNIDQTVDGAQETLGDRYLGWTAPGEWAGCTVDVRASGPYAVHAHLTSRTDTAEISLAVDGADLTGPVRLPTTTRWHIWRLASNLTQVRLEKGVHVLRLSVLKEGNFNLDYLEFEPLGAAPKAAVFPAVGAMDQVKKMARGLNIIGYDPLWKDFSKARLQESHFRRMREGGFQTVRVNLDAFSHMNADNRLSAAWFKTLDWAVNAAVANDLTVILDEHNATDCGRDVCACKPKLMAFWEQVAEHYKDAPASVVFEILNEPNGQMTPGLWNEWAREALAIIRKSNPTRNVVIGPANWNGIRALNQLELPEDDRHIIVTVHYYLPLAFTHQGAPWSSKQNASLSGVTWGSEKDKRRVDADFAGVQQWANDAGRPILLGEFGAYEKAEMESRVRYTSYLARAAESLGWCWTYWQFDFDFIAWDMAKDDWVAPIHSALVP